VVKNYQIHAYCQIKIKMTVRFAEEEKNRTESYHCKGLTFIRKEERKGKTGRIIT